MTKKERLIVIEANNVEQNYLKDLWFYRGLLVTLTWRDIKVRYKQTIIGITWAILKPLLTILIFSFVFGKIAILPSEGNLPYEILVMMGVLPWQFFNNAVSESSNSIVGSEKIISKVYFPRLLIPTSSILTGIVDFIISLIIFLFFLILFGYAPSKNIIWLPFFFLILTVFSCGVGYFFSAINVKYRDFRYALPFFLQLGLFVSPIGFSSNIIPDQIKLFYELNPLVGIINGFRWCIGGGETILFPTQSLFTSIIISIVTFFLGFYVFRKMEKTFADII